MLLTPSHLYLQHVASPPDTQDIRRRNCTAIRAPPSPSLRITQTPTTNENIWHHFNAKYMCPFKSKNLIWCYMHLCYNAVAGGRDRGIVGSRRSIPSTSGWDNWIYSYAFHAYKAAQIKTQKKHFSFPGTVTHFKHAKCSQPFFECNEKHGIGSTIYTTHNAVCQTIQFILIYISSILFGCKPVYIISDPISQPETTFLHTCLFLFQWNANAHSHRSFTSYSEQLNHWLRLIDPSTP